MSFLISKHLRMKRTIIPYAIALLTLITGIASTIIWMRTDWFDRYLQEFVVQDEAKDDPSDPEHYANITDVVKMFIAKYQLIAEIPDEKDQIDKKTKKMIKKWENSSRTYGELLQKDNNSEISKELLKKYNSFTPDFSEFHKKEEKVWTFTEKNTGVNFEVSIIAGVLSIETLNIGEYQYRLKAQNKRKREIQYIRGSAFVEDEVRFILANAHPEYAYYQIENSELISRTDDKIENIANKIDDYSLPAYKIALTQLCTKGSNFEKKYASRLLQIYNELEINITSVQQDEERDYVYHFIEENSRVHFTVGLSDILSYCVEDVWDLKRYTEYLETGVFKDAPDGSTWTDSMDNESMTNGLSDAEKEQRNEILIDIVERAYSGKAKDEEILHPEFYKIFYKVLSKDNNYDSWANVGYWKYNDGHLHSYHINGVWENEWQVYVMVYLEDIEQHDQFFGDIHDVGLYMLQYNGKWYISGIDGFTKDHHLVYAMSDMIHYLL